MEIKSIYTGDHVIMQIITKNVEPLTKIEVTDKYLRDVSKVAEMTLLESPRVFSVPFVNELETYTKKLEKELSELGIESKVVDEMRLRIDERNNGESGVTGTVTWAESHAASHTWPQMEFITIDLYSCKSFDIEKVVEYTKKYWDADFIVYRVINRYTDKNVVSSDITMYKNVCYDKDCLIG